LVSVLYSSVRCALVLGRGPRPDVLAMALTVPQRNSAK